MPLRIVTAGHVNALLERMGLPDRVSPFDRQDQVWMLMITHLLDRIEALEARTTTSPE